MFMVISDIQIVATSLPTTCRMPLGIAPDKMSWISNCIPGCRSYRYSFLTGFRSRLNAWYAALFVGFGNNYFYVCSSIAVSGEQQQLCWLFPGGCFRVLLRRGTLMSRPFFLRVFLSCFPCIVGVLGYHVGGGTAPTGRLSWL
jgi:hypothetical protein